MAQLAQCLWQSSFQRQSFPAEPIFAAGGNSSFLQDLGFDAVLGSSFKPRGLVPRAANGGDGRGLGGEKRSIRLLLRCVWGTG